MFRRTDDLRIRDVRPLIPPAILLEEIPISERRHRRLRHAQTLIEHHRRRRSAARVIVGPCSIHDTEAALEYGERLKTLADRYAGHLVIVMRTLLREAAHLGRLERADQRSRSRRELPHQQRASPGPPAAARPQRPRPADRVGVSRHPDPAAYRRPHVVGRDRRAHGGKPGAPRARVRALDAGRLQEQHRRQHQIAVDAVLTARSQHWFPSVTKQGVSAIFQTVGNDACHVILRGGTRTGPNYDAEHMAKVCARLAAGAAPRA